MSWDTFESVGGKLKQWHLKFPPFDICRGAYGHSIMFGWQMSSHANFKRGQLSGGGGGGAAGCLCSTLLKTIRDLKRILTNHVRASQWANQLHCT